MNKGEWSEPYVALRILGDGKLYLSDEKGRKKLNEWMNVIEVIRQELSSREVKYGYDTSCSQIRISVNNRYVCSVPVSDFLANANKLKNEISNGKGSSFSLSSDLQKFFKTIEITKTKAKSINKSDIFLTITDPRNLTTRSNIGFSVKSKFGENPTLFNTAPASAAIYEITNMDESLAENVNKLFDNKGNVTVKGRCQFMKSKGCDLKFVGFPVAVRAKCDAFNENLLMINSHLPVSIAWALKHLFYDDYKQVSLKDVVDEVISYNPCQLNFPELKYPYMLKSFVYAAYCGMTASTIWDGKSQVNGGFISVNEYGEVTAKYALESEEFKNYLYENCYFEFPSTAKVHGNYGFVYRDKNNGKYYFRLNFQIRYR